MITIVEGIDGKARITVKGKGGNFNPPGLPLNQDSAVTAQLINRDGKCWEAMYSTPASKNQPNLFKDKGD